MKLLGSIPLFLAIKTTSLASFLTKNPTHFSATPKTKLPKFGIMRPRSQYRLKKDRQIVIGF